MQKINIGEQAGRLTEPFTMIDLLQVDDMAVSLFLCQGSMPFHRHVDQDELFLVHSGTISLESDWGTAVLRPGELSVVPKGVGHRSSSLLRSLVLLLQPRLLVNRRNGHRKLFALKDGGRLAKVSVPAMGRQVAIPFSPVPLADLDMFVVTLTLCQGKGPFSQADDRNSLVMCYDGRVVLETETGETLLGAGEVMMVPCGQRYRLSSDLRAIVLSLERHPQPGLPLGG